MQARLRLSSLDNNHLVDRQQATPCDGELTFFEFLAQTLCNHYNIRNDMKMLYVMYFSYVLSNYLLLAA